MDTELIPLRQLSSCHLSFAKARLKWIRNQSLSVSFSAATSPLRRRGFSNPRVHPCLAFQGEVATSVVGEVCFFIYSSIATQTASSSSCRKETSPLAFQLPSLLYEGEAFQIHASIHASPFKERWRPQSSERCALILS